MTFKIETKYEMILNMRLRNIINNDKWRWHDMTQLNTRTIFKIQLNKNDTQFNMNQN